MNNIAVYGATDRFNYGDLLFPLVLKWGVARNYERYDFCNLATVNSDLSLSGGLPTKKISEVINNCSGCEFDRFIIAGGQVLDAKWTAILGYLLGPKTDLVVRAMRKIFGESLTDSIARRVAGVDWAQPFVVPVGAFSARTRIVYNAVGGADVLSLRTEYQESLTAALKQASYISVRDHSTQTSLAKLGVIADLVPDSALVMSKIYSLSYLKSQVRTALNAVIFDSLSPYLVFQIGTKFVKGREDAIAKKIFRIAKAQGLNIILLAIGRAAAHEDHLALEKVYSNIPDKNCVYKLFDGNVLEIMATIAHAKIYIGTSLHGAITAMSFGVPRLAFTSEVKKLHEFQDTWDIEEFSKPMLVDDNDSSVGVALSVGSDILHKTTRSLVDAASLGLEKAVC